VKHLETAAANVHRVERIQHLEVVECLLQGVRARFSERFKVGKKLRKDKTFENY
jgi:hypothetical protein